MRFLLIVLLCGSGLRAQSVLDRVVDCRIAAPGVAAALRQLSDCAEVDIAFSAGFFADGEPQDHHFDQQPLEVALQRLLAEREIAFKISDGRILLFRKAVRRYTLSGYIEREDSGERLVSATLYCPALGLGTLTNEYGFFSIELPEGTHRLQCSYLGFKEKNWDLNLRRNTQQLVQLETANYLTEIIVTPDSLENPYFFSQEDDFYELSPELIRLAPSLGGESDPVRVAQLLPGIQAGSDGLGGVQVRGSDNGHNRMLLDGVPVYIPYHLLGMFSVFNASTVRSAKLLTGGFSARYGGSLASVFDVRIREGNRYRWSSEAAINLSNAQLLVEGPLVKEKASLLLAGRFNYSTRLFAPTLKRTLSVTEDSDLESAYLDYNVKFNYEISEKDHLYLSYYRGGDGIALLDSLNEVGFSASTQVELSWGNTITALRWNHLFNERLFANLSLTYSLNSFDFSTLLRGEFILEEEEEEELELFFYSVNSANTDHGIRLDLDYLPNPRHTLRFGAGVVARAFTPSINIFDQDSEELDQDDFDEIIDFDGLLGEATTTATDLYLYGEDRWKINDRLELDAGLRASLFRTAYASHLNLEPRLTLKYALNPRLSWSGSAGRMVQYLHLIASTSLQFPTDLWLPASDDIDPQTSWLLESYLRWEATERTRVSVGVYQKWLGNLYLLAPFSNTLNLTGEDIDESLLPGEGQSRGIELFVDHHRERSGLIASYVLSTATRAYAEINGEEKFPFDYDARHQGKVFYYQRIGKHWQLSTNWIYNSPHPQRYVQPAPFGSSQVVDTGTEQRNELRSVPYHRLDFEATYSLQRPKCTHQFTLGGYNLYNRRNIAFYEVPFDEQVFSPSSVSALPFMPTLSYRAKF